MVGATLVVALLVYHQHWGWRTGPVVAPPSPFTTNIGVVQQSDHKGRPYSGLFSTPNLNAYLQHVI